ncbi:hypothetical protein JOM56_004524 [Amanita muscaria]
MTSTAGGPPGVLDEINALFSWNPPTLIETSGSTATRPPSFYDKHFSHSYVLKRVVRLPSLVQDLANNVDNALEDALATLPPLNTIVAAQTREDEIPNFSKRVPDEKAVADFYHLTTARYCAPVASTLALHPKASFSKWRSLLYWTQSSAPPTNYAIMDGLLCFMDKGDGWAAIVGSMENEDRRVFEEMAKSVSALATWEMKSTSAGPAEVMNAVLNLGDFNWTFCRASGVCRSGFKNHKKARDDVDKVTVGFDGKVPLWNLPVFASSSATFQRPPVTPPAASGSSMPPPPRPSASRSSNHGSPTKVQGKKRKRGDDKAYQNAHDKTAQSLAQQAWAQAVRVDGTLIVLHSGNHEIVCVRHRGSQTLYVSNVIQPPACSNPGYGKLHVGIYIAAVQDAMNRWKEKPSDHNGGSGRGRNRGAGRGRKRGGLAELCQPSDEPNEQQKTIHVASNRNVVLLYLQYDVYDSPNPASFLRSAPSIMAHPRCPTPRFSTRAIRTYGLEECLTIVLTSEIGRGSTGVVHRGTLELEVCDGAMPLDVVVKLAFDTGQRDALKNEYKVYRRLRSKGVLQGIPTVLGLFDDFEGAACALVMLYAGVPLVKEPQHIVPASDRKSALSTLESIHHAGILHGDIRRENVLMGDSGLTIIDFGHSEQCDNQKAKDNEFAQLRYLLGLARESD